MPVTYSVHSTEASAGQVSARCCLQERSRISDSSLGGIRDSQFEDKAKFEDKNSGRRTRLFFAHCSGLQILGFLLLHRNHPLPQESGLNQFLLLFTAYPVAYVMHVSSYLLRLSIWLSHSVLRLPELKRVTHLQKRKT